MKSNFQTLNFCKDMCIVSLSTSEWEHQHWVSRQFLMYELSKFCPVIYATGRKDLRNIPETVFLKNKSCPEPPPFEPPPDLYVQKPPLLTPFIYKYDKLNRKLADYYGSILRKKCKRVSSGKIVAYVWEPGQIELLQGLKPDMVVYHPYDKFEAMAKTTEDKIRIRLLEEKIVKTADFIITPHKSIADSLHHKNAHVIHNAVFTPALTDNVSRTTGIFENIPHPRLGYIGMISLKLDYELLLEIARKKPDFSIILMGPKSAGLWKNSEAACAVKNLSNVYFLPPIKFDKVFEHMFQFDLGIMPYSLSGHMGFCESPLKLYQYWSCGLPVVSTKLPNVVDRPGIISCASTAPDWIKLIEDALKNNSDALKKQRQRLALKNSWENRAKKIFSLLSQPKISETG